jgi:hypothetical protein
MALAPSSGGRLAWSGPRIRVPWHSSVTVMPVLPTFTFFISVLPGPADILQTPEKFRAESCRIALFENPRQFTQHALFIAGQSAPDGEVIRGMH